MNSEEDELDRIQTTHTTHVSQSHYDVNLIAAASYGTYIEG